MVIKPPAPVLRSTPSLMPREPLREPQRSAVRGLRLGVLPLQAVSANLGESQLALGLAGEITTALTRSRGLNVVSSHLLAQFAESTRDETVVRETFNTDYVVDGSVQIVGNRVRVTLHLLDLKAGNQVAWARRFDGHTGDPLSLQDEIVAAVAADIEPEILAIEARRVTALPSASPSA
jgi:TolB-like protein